MSSDSECQVASSGVNNFSFFNRRASIESGAELADYLAGSLLATRQDIAAGRLVYDPAVTYMSLIVGDGDNIAFMKGGRRGWMEERVSYCQSQGECSVQVIMTVDCPPRLRSLLSPAGLLYVSPPDPPGP